MIDRTLDFFRCPETLAQRDVSVPVGDDLVKALKATSPDSTETDRHFISSAACEQIIESLLYEKYSTAKSPRLLTSHAVRNTYYRLRPLLGVGIRRLLQKTFFSDWQARPFPSWPVDRTVDRLHEEILSAAMSANSLDAVPFIWFWPDRKSGCALITHDVETAKGLQFSNRLMDIDDSFGIKSAFQIVPEHRYHATEEQIKDLKARGFEVNIHDLNHDGMLYDSIENFTARVGKINAHGKRLGARGFRAGALYRNQSWYGRLKFEYDMSVPNVAHLDPQHGGCCTTFPYFIGDILELPVTLTQDYSLFQILGDYSISLWQRQIGIILQHHGMIHVIAHPDYLLKRREQQIYESLLAEIADLRAQRNVWVALPGEVNDWWRKRDKMTLQCEDGGWSIRGEGSERACLAYAQLRNNSVELVVSPVSQEK